jgi:hypothetical protein
VYAAGLEAVTVIWISRLFWDDVWTLCAVFEVVSRPNDWQKGIKGVPPGGASHVSTPLNEARQDLFGEILDGVNAKRPAIRVPDRNRDSWTSFASGPFESSASDTKALMTLSGFGRDDDAITDGASEH